MSVLSKQAVYNEAFRNLKCYEGNHPWQESCIKNSLQNSAPFLKGITIFMISMYMVKVFTKLKVMDRAVAKKLGLEFVQSILFGFAQGHLFVLGSCVLRRVLGEFNYNFSYFVPGLIAGFSIFIENTKNKDMFSYFFKNLVFDFIVKELETTKIIHRNVNYETVIFMLTNAYMMYLLRVEPDVTTSYWVVMPPKVKQLKNGFINGNAPDFNFCPHSEDCKSHIINGTRKYFALGLIFSILKNAFSIRKTSWKNMFFKLLFNKNTWSLGVFLGGYVAVYRSVSCYLCQITEKDHALYAVPAAFLAGIFGWFVPRVFFVPPAVIVQLYLRRAQRNGTIPKSFPLNEVSFIICSGFLYHSRLTAHCHPYIKNMMAITTSGMSDRLADSVHGRCNKFAADRKVDIRF